jgi:murein DD-endopeptidase MepM/ murein hydrolase activator NlpD
MAGPLTALRIAEAARRSGIWKWGVVALVGAVLLPMLAVAAIVGAAWDAVANLANKPTQVTAMAAYMAASKCDFAPDVKLGTAYLVAGAPAATSDGATGFGRYKNPVGLTSDAVVPDDILKRVDQGALRTGGFTNVMLGLPGDYLPRDWTTVLPDTRGEWGVGFLLLRPSDWRQWVSEVPDANPEALDPYKPYDALVVLACHLKNLEGQALGALDGTLAAIKTFAGQSVLQFLDQVADVVRRDASTPWLVPVDLGRAMTAFAAGRGAAFLQRVQAQFQLPFDGAINIPPGGGSGQFGWPMRGPITQLFGCTDFLGEPFDPSCPTGHIHTGLDIAAPFGTPIAAADTGVVTVANLGWGGGYGNHVMITHGNGYQTLYGHMSTVLVSVGQPVQRGQVIGLEGSTGFSTGPHLHFEIRHNGAFQNPLAFLN